ncbi:hypothetical protein SprV_0301109300 [Sparganum proliferum]
MDNIALGETYFSEQDQLQEVGAGYVFFWDDHPNAERRDACISFAAQNDILGRLSCLPQGVHDPLMIICLSLRGSNFATIINA